MYWSCSWLSLVLSDVTCSLHCCLCPQPAETVTQNEYHDHNSWKQIQNTDIIIPKRDENAFCNTFRLIISLTCMSRNKINPGTLSYGYCIVSATTYLHIHKVRIKWGCKFSYIISDITNNCDFLPTLHKLKASLLTYELQSCPCCEVYELDLWWPLAPDSVHDSETKNRKKNQWDKTTQIQKHTESYKTAQSLTLV